MDPRPALDALLFGGIVLFGVGFFWRDRRCHLARAAAWAAFGAFWFMQVPAFLGEGDPVNTLGAAAALPVFLFLAAHEKRSYDWREEYQPLRFLAGGAFFAAGIYFAIDRVPLLSGGLIQLVANHTAFLLNGLSPGYGVGAVNLAGNLGWWRVNGGEIYAPVIAPGGTAIVNIILACTAIQGITITAALVPGTTDPPRRKALVLAILVPITYGMNLLRNVVVISLYHDGGEWEFVHNGYGKGLSFAVLLVLMLVAFWLLPELYLNINGLFELPWRRSRGHDYRAHVGRILGKLARPKAVEKKLDVPRSGGGTDPATANREPTDPRP